MTCSHSTRPGLYTPSRPNRALLDRRSFLATTTALGISGPIRTGRSVAAADSSDQPADASAAKQSVLNDPNFFPLAVWLQNPANAARYKAAGINLYVALWRGP